MINQFIKNSFPELPLTATNTPSLSELSALCNHVYGSLPDVKGWKLYRSKIVLQEKGINLACYLKFNNKEVSNIVFAFRGTDGNWLSLADDLMIALGQTPFNIYELILFMQNCIEDLIESKVIDLDNPKPMGMSVTGHSLGGVFSDLCLLFLSAVDPTVQSITFENPGSYPIVQKFIPSFADFMEAELRAILIDQNGKITPEDEELIKQEKKAILNSMPVLRAKCKTILNEINPINTCNEQLGAVYRAQNRNEDIEIIKSNTSIPPYPLPNKHGLFNEYYLFTHLGIYHSIDKLSEYLSKGGICKLDKNPIGFKNGYLSYIDYSKRKDYWDKYAQVVWNARLDLHSVYADFNKYHETLVKYLGNIRMKLKYMDEKTLIQKFNFFKSQDNIKSLDDLVIIPPNKQLHQKENEPGHSCSIM